MDRHFLDHLVYSWAVTNSLGMSAIGLLIAFLLAQDGSIIAKLNSWRWFVIMPLFMSWIWQVSMSVRMDMNVASNPVDYGWQESTI